MNKKGVTLIELIAAITILSILSLIAVPAINTVRQNSLKKAYDSKISMIKDAALDYVKENAINNVKSCKKKEDGTLYCECHHVKIGDLIAMGYLPGDSEDKDDILDPQSGESLYNKFICVKFNNDNVLTRKLITNDTIEELQSKGEEDEIK